MLNRALKPRIVPAASILLPGEPENVEVRDTAARKVA